jgi:hypothetical protein
MATLNVQQTGANVIEAFRKVLSRRIVSLYVSGNAIATPITLTQTYYPVSVISTALYTVGFTAVDSVLTLTAGPGRYLINAGICLTLPASNIEVRCRIGKNGVALPQTCSRTTITGNPSSGQNESLALHTILDLETNDTINLFVGNWTGTADITCSNLQITATEL